MRFFFTNLFIALLLASLRPTGATAQGAIYTRVTYYDAAHTQRRAVFGTVLGVRGSRPDTMPHGPYRRYWRTGSLAEVGHFTQGLADSVWTRYYPAAPGQAPAIARRLAMRAGQPDGPFVVLHPNGRLAQRGTFRCGQLLDSVTTRTAGGQPRLLAHFDSPATDSARLTGSFRQWRSGVTAQPLSRGVYNERPSYIAGNPYPAADTGRYWVGQLVAGHFAGPLAEYDPNGQLRVQLLYNQAGKVRVTSLYYPAAWREYELSSRYLLDSGQIVRSQLYWQSQWLGHDLLWQYYDWGGSPSKPTNGAVIRPAPVPRLPRPSSCLQAPLPPVVLPAKGALLSARAAFNPFYRYKRGQEILPTPSKYGAAADQHYQQAQKRRRRRHSFAHLLG